MNKVTNQDHVITQLVGDNLNHLQANIRLTTHINSSQTRMGNLEHQLEELGELFLAVMGQSSLDQGTQESDGDNEDNQDGGEDNVGAGASPSGNMRPLTPAPRERGLIKQMEEEVKEAGLGGWFNRMDQGLPESWSGPNSDTSESQD